jgi:RNA-directed DNA polymerase
MTCSRCQAIKLIEVQEAQGVRVLIARLNPVLRAGGTTFPGNASLKFNPIDRYVRGRLRLFLARRRGYRRKHQAIRRWSFEWFWGLGLYRLSGTVRYPAAHA